jgi:hypothetical protein
MLGIDEKVGTKGLVPTEIVWTIASVNLRLAAMVRKHRKKAGMTGLRKDFETS